MEIGRQHWQLDSQWVRKWWSALFDGIAKINQKIDYLFFAD
jgi:hypothetical protein